MSSPRTKLHHGSFKDKYRHTSQCFSLLVMEQKKLNNKANTISLENEIDQLVYQLYDLTAEEIAVVVNI